MYSNLNIRIRISVDVILNIRNRFRGYQNLIIRIHLRLHGCQNFVIWSIHQWKTLWNKNIELRLTWEVKGVERASALEMGQKL